MNIRFTTPTAALLAAIALPALSLPAFAQTSPAPATAPTSPASPAAPAKPHTAKRPMVRDLTPEQRAQRVEQRITQLHADLQITPAQEPNWKQFAQVMRDNAKNMDKTFEQRGTRLSGMSAADNMQSYADVAVAHAQDVQRLAVAFQSLYGELSPAQKHSADLLFRHEGRGHRKP